LTVCDSAWKNWKLFFGREKMRPKHYTMRTGGMIVVVDGTVRLRVRFWFTLVL